MAACLVVEERIGFCLALITVHVVVMCNCNRLVIGFGFGIGSWKCNVIIGNCPLV